MATIEERNLLAERLFSSVGTNAAKLPNEEITGFLSMKGHAYNHELMVIGRAVNRFAEGILPNNLCNPVLSTQYAQNIFDAVIGGVIEDRNRCPMLWVTDWWGTDRAGSNYNTAKSAFWRVIRQIINELHIPCVNDQNWPSHLVWSNLYKIAPSKGGNPGSKLCDIQLQGCLELLQMEVTNYLPRRILFLTGINWARPFITALHGNINARNPAFTHVEAYGSANTAAEHQYRFVVASHPMGKPECPWVNEVLQAFQL